MNFSKKAGIALFIAVLAALLFSGCDMGPASTTNAPASTTAAPTDTSAAQPSPTAAPTATPEEAWSEYAPGGIKIGLPASWEAVDVAKDGANAIIEKARSHDEQWAQGVAALAADGSVQSALKFWAMDTVKAGSGFATANVAFEAMPGAVTAEDILSQAQSIYSNAGGITVVSARSVKINGLDAAQIELKAASGPSQMHEYQYYFLKDGNGWLLTLAAEEAQWDACKSVFEQIANTFQTSN